MYKTSFPINDLLRRKSQTTIVIICLTLSVASTLFLLLFSSRLGLDVASVNENTFTVGISNVFSQFIRFIGILFFIVGAALASFIVFLMMTQRTRDFGLIKAAGCPNDLLFGYYIFELLTVALVGCTLGIIIGVIADYVYISLSGLMLYPNPATFWLALLVFVAFLILTVIFGTKPILSAAQMPPLTALSPVQYFGLAVSAKAKTYAKSHLTANIAFRSLFRHKRATIRILLLLSATFVLLTVAIAGSIIAQETTILWVRRASGQNITVIANENLAAQYTQLQLAFMGSEKKGFDYVNLSLSIPNEVIQELHLVSGIEKVDERLIIEESVYEIANFTIDPDTLVTIPVGDHRQATCLVVGIEPDNITANWFTEGQFLAKDSNYEVVVGDSIARTVLSQPLVQSLRIQGRQFSVKGICVDPINNGKIVYMPLKNLQEIVAVNMSNIVFIALDPKANNIDVRRQIADIAKNAGLITFELEGIVDKNSQFLGSTWSTIMLLPLFSLFSATFCLVAYVILVIDEQRHEFGYLRAVGAKPKTIISIISIQSFAILFSSCCLGLSIGTILTLMILMRQPVITGFMIFEISAWLLAALTGMFVLSLIPAFRFARASLLKIMS